jgi:cytochrome c peroxidase
VRWALPLLTAAVGACAPPAIPFEWDLPEGFSEPAVPEDNPMSWAKVELGRHLFYDPRLSLDGTLSCGSCHLQRLAFTDGSARPTGVTGEVHPRSAMSLANAAYVARLSWANPLLGTLEEQALLPLFGESPVELGLVGREDELFARLSADPAYPAMFAEAFPEEDGDPIRLGTLLRALAAFERTLISGNSPFDRYRAGDVDALSPEARRGFDLFRRRNCAECHRGFTFDSTLRAAGRPDLVAFHQTGLYDVDGRGAYPFPNTGVHEVTLQDADMGRFRAPTLRNIAVTAPYMHDGSMATLDEVLDHYAAGGRARSGRTSWILSSFELSPEDRAAFHAFFRALTDEGFLTNPRFADPFD